LGQSQDIDKVERDVGRVPFAVRKVVTVFLTHRGRILLLRRSDRVGSYQGRWAGISGFIEPDEEPLERALKEVSEEVGLDNESLSLVKRARPFPALDAEINTLWAIHPFLFSTNSPKIKLDWEHDAFRWIGRQDLHKFETVPKLEEALERVTQEAIVLVFDNPMIQTRLRAIREDRVHGATELSHQALTTLRLLAQTSVTTRSEDLLAELRILGRGLEDARPSMAPLTNLVEKVLQTIERKKTGLPTLRELKQVVMSVCDELAEESETAVRKIAMNAAQLIQDDVTVLTHSRSRTVTETLKQAMRMGKRIRVIVTESRPLLEGRIVAKELAELGIPVTLIVDSAVGGLMHTADVCVVGADSVLFDGSFVNKTGTYPLAVVAREHGKPLYVVCEKSKFNLRSIFEPRPEIEEKDLSEVLPYPMESLVTVRNPYFDTTPAEFVSKFITDEGTLSAGELSTLFRRMILETCV